jgi:hypothetical protein
MITSPRGERNKETLSNRRNLLINQDTNSKKTTKETTTSSRYKFKENATTPPRIHYLL